MKPIREYNEVEAFYHGISQRDFDALLAEANASKVEDIVLYGRVFNPDLPLLEAEAKQDYENVRGAGYVYACDYYNRENATPGASAMSGVQLILGWDGEHYDEEIKKDGEWLIPLSAYKVVGVVDEEYI